MSPASPGLLCVRCVVVLHCRLWNPVVPVLPVMSSLPGHSYIDWVGWSDNWFIHKLPSPTMNAKTATKCVILCLLLSSSAFAQIYPDQHYVLRIDSLFQSIETNDGLMLSADGKSIVLQPDRIDGSVILKPQYSQSPFNQGLPSWNGTAPDANSAFKIQMRFPYSTGWSPWLTVGFWKSHIWSSYGSTSYSGGMIDYDNAVVNSYIGAWQFKIIMKRTAVDQPSPTVHKLSFLVSDSRTTSTADYTQILNDKPASILIPTNFIYQYGVDPTIGGSICSPTSVAMILRSYNITVDPYQFALATYDPHFNMFGIWPRVVQNASEYGLDGAVTRYRSWSQAREVLVNGGRISMSVGQPLYEGHLIMLAGFTAAGDPIVHDPAKSNGYSYVFNKSQLSHAWFDKGGVAYTFYPAEPVVASVDPSSAADNLAGAFRLDQNYPNPFNPTTTVRYFVGGVVAPSEASSSGVEGPDANHVKLAVYDLLGREVAVLVNDQIAPGTYTVRFDASHLTSGVYFCRMTSQDFSSTTRMILAR
jgi:hypothetical protein